MAKIKQLPVHEAQKIAAGEVVERPANIVKELVENAIDAGATTIDLYIEDGGKKLIRIVDNGCGMSPEDARLSFAHHATSKLQTVDDLHHLTTFGFRGEALSSMASVSRTTMITKDNTMETGCKLTIAFGTFEDEEDVAAPVGTDIQVRDLFTNVPARKKFLKTTDTEWNQIVQFFQASCLTYPTIHFKLFNHGKLVHNCPIVNSTRERCAQLWPQEIEPHLIDLPNKSTQISEKTTLTGIISNHQFSRYNRQHIFLFVNNRWVKNQTLSRAVLNGYANVLQSGKYPVATLFITIPTEQVDINIHPRKEEVRFLHPRTVEVLISSTIKKALETHLSAQISKPVTINQSSYQTNSSNYNSYNYTPARKSYESYAFNKALLNQPFDDLPPTEIKQPAHNLHDDYHDNHDIHQFISHEPVLRQNTIQSLSEQEEGSTEGTQEHITLIGQFYKTYLLLERPDGLFILDQHAAHERILYERFSQKFAQSDTVQLMFPQRISFSSNEVAQLMTVQNIFKRYGLIIEQSGSEDIMVTSAPVYSKHIDFKELLCDTLTWLEQYQELAPEEFVKKINHALCAQMACKAAVKAGDVLNEQQMQQLLIDLAQTENRFSCPHGRPTGWLLSAYEIEKKFKRRT